jgi:hypothetical protein
MREHDFEPVRGLPAALPQGETLLWQGRPSARRLACDAFHIRAVAAYFAVMIGWSVASSLAGGASLAKVMATEAAALPIALAGLGLLAGLAFLNSRTSVYTITSKRVVLRFGAGFTKAINIPFTVIDGASLKSYGDGSGDLALKLKAPNKIAMLQLWPHVRPGRFAQPEPSLRSVADVRVAGEVLTRAMADRIVVTGEAVASAPSPAPVPAMSGARLAGAAAA